ncbi:hypothetical protein NEOC65_001954 [Neochlamydia sp. AcF65]|nr:hypothetical protein [Neochlamydia sp. AcF65]NGY94224.1 hypothetical protein [Neochlamydia sp. AcF84]
MNVLAPNIILKLTANVSVLLGLLPLFFTMEIFWQFVDKHQKAIPLWLLLNFSFIFNTTKRTC